MPFEETREQQQIYNLFRSCIYICLIIELVVNVPIAPDDAFVSMFVRIISSINVFNTVGSAKIAEFVCVLITCIGTTAKKSLKFNVRNMVVFPVVTGEFLLACALSFYSADWGNDGLGRSDKPVGICGMFCTRCHVHPSGA